MDLDKLKMLILMLKVLGLFLCVRFIVMDFVCDVFLVLTVTNL